MITPPNSRTLQSFLTAISALTWTQTKLDPSGAGIGVLKNGSTTHYVGVVSGGTDGTWATDTTLRAGFGLVLMSRDTAAVWQGGTLQADGRILYSGTYYRIASYFDGADWTARAVAAAA